MSTYIIYIIASKWHFPQFKSINLFSNFFDKIFGEYRDQIVKDGTIKSQRIVSIPLGKVLKNSVDEATSTTW